MKAAAVVLLIVGIYLIVTAPATAAPPPDPNQQRPDIFPCSGCNIVDRDGDGDGDMQDLNPTTRKAKATRAVTYRVELRPGCSTGTMPADLERMNVHAREAVGLNITRNDTSYDFKVFISCGLEQVNKCGSVTVFCLPDGFPYNTDVYMSDVLSNYQIETRLSIPLHELVGHAVGTWNEQYASCGSSCGFASTSNLRDFMNTGPLSRHGFETSELGRWERTMWSLQAVVCESPGDPYWDPCINRWVFASGWSVDVRGNNIPADDQWYDKTGRLYWTGVEPWGGRCSPVRQLCAYQGTPYYDQTLGDPWVLTP